jgi:hypothetical protein
MVLVCIYTFNYIQYYVVFYSTVTKKVSFYTLYPFFSMNGSIASKNAVLAIKKPKSGKTYKNVELIHLFVYYTKMKLNFLLYFVSLNSQKDKNYLTKQKNEKDFFNDFNCHWI